jgi:SAM-dependent methyltransferase
VADDTKECSLPKYWLGNAAKSQVMDRITEFADRSGGCCVFDYGAGDAGDWPSVLQDRDDIQLVCYEPDEARAHLAREALKGLSAEVLTGSVPSLDNLDADVVVSFSVLEHVWDKASYLRKAAAVLASHGTFYLNYDDGHFRIQVDLERPKSWRSSATSALHNLLAPTLAKQGWTRTFQQRVQGENIDRMVRDAGFRCTEVFYSNLRDFKRMMETIPEEQRASFAKLWIDTEKVLNDEFRVELDSPVVPGDNTNLWGWMPSRTLVLQHAE